MLQSKSVECEYINEGGQTFLDTSARHSWQAGGGPNNQGFDVNAKAGLHPAVPSQDTLFKVGENRSWRLTMAKPILTDKNQFPTDEVISSHIGKSKALWHSLFEYVHHDHPDFTEQWKYYNDGKSWLLKVSRKAKTIFWLSVVEGSFRTTFYFTDRAQQAITKSPLSDDLKEQYRSGKRYNKIRGLTITYKNSRDVEYAKQLIGIKTSMK
jgi:hypothetical protein